MKYCIKLIDGNYVFGFDPQTGCVSVTHLNSLALSFDRTTEAMQFLDKYSTPDNGLAFKLIAGIREQVGQPIIEAA